MKEQSMLSADQGEMMIIKLDKYKVEEGKTDLIKDNKKLKKRIHELQREITTKSLRIERLEQKLNK